METKETRRQALHDELRRLEENDGSRSTQLQIIKVLQTCRCRNCGTKYLEPKSRADYKGFCSAGCLHDKAIQLGYKKKKGWQPLDQSEYAILHKAGMIGSVFVDPIDLEFDLESF